MDAELNSLEKELLNAIGMAVNFSLGGHYSKQEISKRLKHKTRVNSRKMKRMDKAYRTLRSKKLIKKHPTGEMTYGLTRDGLHCLRESMNID